MYTSQVKSGCCKFGNLFFWWIKTCRGNLCVQKRPSLDCFYFSVWIVLPATLLGISSTGSNRDVSSLGLCLLLSTP